MTREIAPGTGKSDAGGSRAPTLVAVPAERRLLCGCEGKCDPYAHDTAPDWDGRPDGPDYTRCPKCDQKVYEGETCDCEG